MPVRGTIVLPSGDTRTPPTPAPLDALFTPEDFGIYQQDSPFAPKELAGKMRVSSDEILDMIEEGRIRAFPLRRGKRTTYRVPYIEVVYFFLRQQGSGN
jgi:hypothetical protein